MINLLGIILVIYVALLFVALTFGEAKTPNVLRYCMTALIYCFHVVAFGTLYFYQEDTEVIILFFAEILMLVITEVVYRRFYARLSKLLFRNVFLLMDIGLVMLIRLSPDKAIRQFSMEAVAVCICCVIPFIIKKVRRLEKFGYFYCVTGLVLLCAVLVGGTDVFGARNWIQIHSLLLQPSEFIKILFLFAMASLLTLSNKKNPLELGKYTRKRMISQLVISFLAFLHIFLLVLENDLGGAFIYFCVYIAIFAISTGNYIFTSIGVSLGVVASVGAAFVFSHVQKRIVAWMDPFSAIEDIGYQITQSLFAIANGGFSGVGLYNGSPEDVPVVVSDFIFSGICEELGAITAICILFIYISCMFLCLNLARNLKDEFYKYVSTGFIVLIGVQTFINVAGALKMIPSTGVTLPFISYGGSSVSSLTIFVMILQGIFEIEGEEREEARKSPKAFARLKKTDRRIFIISSFCAGLLLACIVVLVLFSTSDNTTLLSNPYNRRN